MAQGYGLRPQQVYAWRRLREVSGLVCPASMTGFAIFGGNWHGLLSLPGLAMAERRVPTRPLHYRARFQYRPVDQTG
jgi:hypothetical protein